MSASLPVLYVRMLRYRVAVMVWMFLFLGIASRGALDSFDPRYVSAMLSLACAYVAATCLNDIADVDVDRVNHPKDSGRPLVTGETTERGLLQVYAVAAPLALAFAIPLGMDGLLITAVSLFIGWAYSLRPIRLSYRTYAAPLVLSIAYVLVPYGLGIVAAGDQIGVRDIPISVALYLLFLARINLKDFRDRAGDAQYGKPTLLLRFGKDVTCLVSAIALALGSVLLAVVLRPPLLVTVLLAGFVVAIASRLYALRRADNTRAEQLAIGIGARAGNGLLTTALAVLVLVDIGAPASDTFLIVAVITAAFGLDFAVLVRRPDLARIGYKA